MKLIIKPLEGQLMKNKNKNKNKNKKIIMQISVLIMTNKAEGEILFSQKCKN